MALKWVAKMGSMMVVSSGIHLAATMADYSVVQKVGTKGFHSAAHLVEHWAAMRGLYLAVMSVGTMDASKVEWWGFPMAGLRVTYWAASMVIGMAVTMVSMTADW